VGGGEAKDPQSGGNGGAPVDVRALIAQLEAELRRTTRRGSSRASSLWLDARASAERTWRVTADRTHGGRGGAFGAAQRPVRAAVRKLVRWYVEPVFADQRTFNAALLKLVDELHAENERLRAELELQRTATEQ
jgi:hypothetical protein